MNEFKEITLAERKYAAVFDLLLFCREFDGYGAKVCIGALGRENVLARMELGDFIVYEVDARRYEVRLTEVREKASNDIALFLVSRLTSTPEVAGMDPMQAVGAEVCHE